MMRDAQTLRQTLFIQYTTKMRILVYQMVIFKKNASHRSAERYEKHRKRADEMQKFDSSEADISWAYKGN